MKSFLLVASLLQFLISPSFACLCIDGSGVNIRSTACGTVIGSANTGACYDDLNQSQVCTLSGVVYTFRRFDYGGRDGWVASEYLVDSAPINCQAPAGCEGFTLITRAQWGARPPNGQTSLSLPLGMSVIHHSEGASCSTQAECSSVVRGIQNYHMDSNGWADIGYNFLIGGDNNAYEGRGWNNQGAHSPACNSIAHGICHIGSFMSTPVSQGMLRTQESLIQCGISQGKITNGWSLHGHRDCTATDCPGNALYAQLQNYPNFGGPVAQSRRMNTTTQH